MTCIENLLPPVQNELWGRLFDKAMVEQIGSLSCKEFRYLSQHL